MKLEVINNKIYLKDACIPAAYEVIEAREVDETIVVIYDYMEFPKNKPARNMFAYNKVGKELWRAEDIGMGATDAYTNILSESPLNAGNFSGFNVSIDLVTGKVIGRVFTK